jgi:hypothetical protein
MPEGEIDFGLFAAGYDDVGKGGDFRRVFPLREVGGKIVAEEEAGLACAGITGRYVAQGVNGVRDALPPDFAGVEREFPPGADCGEQHEKPLLCRIFLLGALERRAENRNKDNPVVSSGKSGPCKFDMTDMHGVETAAKNSKLHRLII